MIEAVALTNSALQGLVLGVLAAFLFKIASNIIKSLFVIQFILLKWLDARGIVIIDWHRLTFGLMEETDFIQQADSMVNALYETGSFGLAALAGFYLTRRFIK